MDGNDYVNMRAENARKRPAYLVDYDGTISLRTGREPHDYARVHEDKPNTPVVYIIQRLYLFSTILIVTARDEVCRLESENWLRAHGIYWDHMFMRTRDDQRPDEVVKKEIYEQHILGKYNVYGVWEDRLRVIRMWESLGVYVLNCNAGRGEF